MKKVLPLILICILSGVFGILLFLSTPFDEPTSLDLKIYEFWRSFNFPIWFYVHRFISFFGDSFFIFPLAFIITLLLVKKKFILEGIIYFIFISFGLLTNASLKVYFSRIRPTSLIDDLWQSYSFPSGHSLGAFIFFMSSTWIFLFLYPQFKKYKTKIWISCFSLIFMIGITRMALGAHWFTDVCSGFTMGGIMICIAKIIKDHFKLFDHHES